MLAAAQDGVAIRGDAGLLHPARQGTPGHADEIGQRKESDPQKTQAEVRLEHKIDDDAHLRVTKQQSGNQVAGDANDDAEK